MENGNIGTGDAAVLALLADTARAGRGGYGYGGYGGEGGGYHGAGFTTPSSLQHGLDALARQGSDQTDSLRDQFENQNLRAAVSALGAGQVAAENRIADKLSDHQLNALRESADLARQIAACCCDTQKGFLEQALRQQECCCETQKLVFQENQKTRDLINENSLRAATDANNISATVGSINAAAAANTAAIVAAIQAQGGHHGGH
jgi:hypothetical protein